MARLVGRSSASVVVLVTCPDGPTAKQLSEALLNAHLAACVNILPGVQSLFWWRGKVERASEVLLVMKTLSTCFEELRRLVLKLHPYEVPEIIGLPIIVGHPPYLRWVNQTVGTAKHRPSH